MKTLRMLAFIVALGVAGPTPALASGVFPMWLTPTFPSRANQKPQWNFHQYLIGRDGEEALSFASRVKPDDGTLLAQIEKLLGR
jgi:glutathione peroxidase-family protein